jgi:hypothetical protein
MSKLAAALDAARKEHRGTPCGVGIILSTLKGEDRDVFLSALRDSTVSKRVLSEVLEKTYGITIAEGTLARHHRKACRCDHGRS